MDEAGRLGGRYEVGRVLGRGGMAEVRLAHDLALDRTVAVKTLRPDLAGDPSCRARFLREARSTASLNHPGIVAVYDTGEDHVPYIVMEYVDGRTLSDVVRTGPGLAPGEALRLTGEVLDALGHAHGGGIVHRDVKPANVMLCADGTVKVMDFGIARSLGTPGVTLTQTAMVIGTAEYLSPEQARGEEVDARTDLYSTGCLLYELLTGRPPFTADSPLAVAYCHVRDAPEPPSARVPGLPPECDAVVLRALAKDRDERFRSAEEMRTAIEHALRSQTAPVTAVSPAAPAAPALGPDPARTTVRRTARRLWTAAAALAALLTAGGAYAATGGGQGPAPAATAVAVPDLVGKTIGEARTGAQAAGLHVVRVGFGICPGRVNRRTDGTAHRVCGQLPWSGSRIARGGSIRIQLSGVAPNP